MNKKNRSFVAVGVTGTFGSGKTTVLKLASGMKIPVIDADSIVSMLYRKPSVKHRIKSEFRTLDREKLAEIVFSSPKKRRILESILHPLVKKEVSARLNALKKKGKKTAFVEIPLLFESGMHNIFAFTIAVHCPQKTLLRRLKKKGFSGKQALRRIKAQLSSRKKIKSSDFVINNGLSIASTKRQVKNLIEKISGELS